MLAETEQEAAVEAQQRRSPNHGVWLSTSCVAFYLLVSYAVVPAGVVALIEVRYAYLLLFVAQLLLAVGAVEWSWLAFRIRQRLLLAVSLHEQEQQAQREQQERQRQQEWQRQQNAQEGEDTPAMLESSTQQEATVQEETWRQQQTRETTADVTIAGEPDEDVATRRVHALEIQPLRREDPREGYTRQLDEVMRAKTFAISPLSERFFCGRWYVAALVLATAGALVSCLLGFWIENSVFDSDQPAAGWRMLVGATVEASFVSIFCSSLAPSASDAVVLVVYQACVLVASMNAYLKLHVDVISADALVDPLFIILAGAIVIIVFRIVSSKVVMQSLLMVLGDVLGLVCIVSPFIAFADLIDHSMGPTFRSQLALFVLVVVAADVGDCLAKQLQRHWPQGFRWWRQAPLLKSEATTKDVEALAISMVCGTIMIVAVRLGSDVSAFNLVEVIVLLVAMALGQWCRLWMTHVRQMAKVTTSAFYMREGSRICGVLDRMALFLVAIIVYYPYIKQKYFATSW